MIGIMGQDLTYSIPIYNTFKKFMPDTAAIILGYGLGGAIGIEDEIFGVSSTFTQHYKESDIKKIKDFLKSNMYNHKKVLVNTNKGKKIINDLFKYLSKNPRKHISGDLFKNEQKERVIADFIAGMTDRYAINLHKKIK